MFRYFVAAVLFLGGVVPAMTVFGEERQITFSAKNHNLDNNDNFSPDGRFLCYDTREMVGPGIENSQSIEKVEIATGAETVLYRPVESVTGVQAAPGVGAVTFSFVENTVAFIHGPLLSDVPIRGYYGKPNRTGAEMVADGGGVVRWLDRRDVATDRETLPGAHRGGTHRHEYSRDGRRIGFTYDDFLLPQYDRTIGYMERHAKAPEGVTDYFALLVRVAPKGTAKVGEIEKAYGDSWVDPAGTMRAFIGNVRDKDGYIESLFVVDVPSSVDITTADSGSSTRYPSPPEGLRVRRLTQGWAGGIVRGSPTGDRIAFYGKAADGTTQVFVVRSDGSVGSDGSTRGDAGAVQVTALEGGAGPGLRWHASGKYVACMSEGGVAVTRAVEGGEPEPSVFLTPHGDGVERINLVWSHDGKTLAYNKPVPTLDAQGSWVRNYDGSDCLQVFVVDFDEGAMGRAR